MKKITAFIIVLLMLTALAACNKDSGDTSSDTESKAVSGDTSENNSQGESSTDESQNNSGETLDGSLEDILAAIYANLDEEYTSAVEYMVTTEIDPGNCNYYFGVETLDFKEGIASEAEMGPSAYSLCLIRANSMDDVEGLKATIKANADPFKWVCVGVEEDEVIVDSIGDVVFLIMYKDAKVLHDAFLALG